MTKIERASVRTDRGTINEILERDGCIVIENVLDRDGVYRLEAELNPHFDQSPPCDGDFYGHRTKRISGLIAKSEVCRRMAVNQAVLSVMDHFLLQGCSAYQLNLTQGIRIGPGEPQQMIHPDSLMFPFQPPGYQCMINCMWAVDDFTIENGATHVVPGSHKWEAGREPAEHEIIQAEMPEGSVLIYFASLLHGGGANRTSEERTGAVISYCLGWLRQAENQYLACPPAVVAALPERLQRLLGYFVHAPNLGCLEGQDPIRLLKGEKLLNGQFKEFLPPEAQEWLEQHKEKIGRAA
jgi:ectoine hydroxylase-related dioxygenase (phytanoyl-CoA dioxygenase family)